MLITRRFTGVLLAAVTAASLATAGAIPAQAATASQHSRHLEARLHGSSAHPAARGHADYMSSWRRELDVSLWHARSLAGHRLIVYVHRTRAGAMTVRRDGSADMHRHHGVPACRAGTSIRVRTRSGTLVVSGTFRRHHRWMMSPASAR